MNVSDKLQVIAENVSNVHEAGYLKGYTEGGILGYDQGYGEGVHLGQSKVWDAIQDSGKRTNYSSAFSYEEWNSDTFQPKNNIKPITALSMFHMTSCSDATKAIDLIKLKEETGFAFDFSECTTLGYAFASKVCFKTIDEVDMRKCTTTGSASYAFYGGYGGGNTLKEIKKIICDENTQFNSTTFNYLAFLEEIRFEGTIGKTGITFASSKYLSYESLMSIVNALKDFSGTGTTMSITLGTENLAKLTDAEKAKATQKGWSLT